MKGLIAATLAGLLSFGTASQAFAISFSPDGQYSASGPFSITTNGASLSCTAMIKFQVSMGSASISTMTFTGGTLGVCALVTANNLPRTMVPETVGTAFVPALQLSTPYGVCGPTLVNLNMNNNPPSFVVSNMDAVCNLVGKLSFSPTNLVITP